MECVHVPMLSNTCSPCWYCRVERSCPRKSMKIRADTLNEFIAENPFKQGPCLPFLLAWDHYVTVDL